MKVANWRWVFGLAVAGSFLGACAQDVPDIDRTSPNKVEKQQFQTDDEWYFRQTIVDTDEVSSAGGGYAFEAFEGPLYRVRWTITEDVLYAMSTVEPAEGILADKYAEDDRRIGVVAAFPITGHFDIERSYNPSTGEQSNVIGENASDRYWYDRKYMRVDWSTNLAGMQQVGGWAGEFAATSRQIPQDDGVVDPDRTRISEDYIDAVTEYYYEPDLYACFTTLGFDSIFNCEGGPLRVRNSFLKRPETETYVPLQYTDNLYIDADGDQKTADRLKTMRIYDPSLQKVFPVQCTEFAKNFEETEFGASTADACEPATFDMFGRFGYFRTERISFDPNRGSNQEEQRLYYANRWNLWDTMLNEDGSVMDMAERSPKKIVYYLNPEYPRDMLKGAEEVAEQWDIAFTNAVALAKGKEVSEIVAELETKYGEGNGHMFEIVPNNCSATGLAAWHGANGTPNGEDRMDVDQIVGEFIEKWSPAGATGADALVEAVWAAPNDSRVKFCANLEFATETREEGAFTWQRVGDLRYSFFNWVDEQVPWLGYGPSAADPVTGQIIAGNANFAGAAIRTYGPYAADIIEYMNGELTTEQIEEGEHIRAYIKRIQNEARQPRQGLSAEGKREMAFRAGLNPETVSPTNFTDRPTIDELPQEILRRGPRGAMEQANRYSLANMTANAADTRMLEFYDDPTVRQYLMRDSNFRMLVESAAASEFGPDFDQADVDQAFLTTTNPRIQYDRYEARNKLMMKQNIMLAENMERAITGLVTYAGVADFFKGKSRDEIEKLFIHNMFVGTQLHEIGHTVGLRHNFSASMDAMNYHDEYWEVQKAIAEGVIQPEERYSVQGDLAREIADDENLEYLNEAEFRLASVMDYTGDLTGRFGGLGKYDEAAINFAYAEMVEQWVDDETLASEFGVQNGLGNFYDTELWLSDYTEVPRIMAGAGGSGPATDPEVQLRGIDVIQNGREWVPIDQAIEQYRQGVLANTQNWENGEFARNVKPYVSRTVPYNFCTDDRANYELGCDVFDYGSNQREIVNHQFDSYRMFQPFRRYNRGRIFRLYENLNHYANWVYSIFKSVERPFRYYSYYQWYDLGFYTDDLREASIDAMNFYSEVMATPEPGVYCKYNTADTEVSASWWYSLENTYVPARWDRNSGNCAQRIEVPKGAAQFYNYNFTDEYDYRIKRVGTFIDKLYAAFAMFEVSSNYVDSAFFTDFRATSVSYWTLFQDELLGFLRGTMLGDYKGFAGVYNRQMGQYERPRIIDAKTFGLGVPSDQVAMDRIYTPMSFSHDFNLLVGAMIYNTTWYDRYTDFGQYMKLAVTNDESQPFPDAAVIHTFTHPVTNQIYVAAQTGDGKSIAVEMVDWANQLAGRLADAKTALDAAEPGTSGYASARELYEFRSEQLEDVVAKMDMVRYVWDALGPNALR